jgi:Predicted acetamidase/formamidase
LLIGLNGKYSFKDLSREEAHSLCSLAVDFRLAQIADGNKSIHGMIPKSIFTKQSRLALCLSLTAKESAFGKGLVEMLFASPL